MPEQKDAVFCGFWAKIELQDVAKGTHFVRLELAI
jgi:hypothetical protein